MKFSLNYYFLLYLVVTITLVVALYFFEGNKIIVIFPFVFIFWQGSSDYSLVITFFILILFLLFLFVMLYFTQYSEKLEDIDKIPKDDIKSSFTGVVFLGPFPVVISNDKNIKKYLIYLFVAGIVIFTVMALIFFGF
jgi:uncharacterized membrane protein